MQSEVVGHLDPFSKQALALTSREAWRQWGRERGHPDSIGFFQDGYLVGLLAPPRFMDFHWKRWVEDEEVYDIDFLTGLCRRGEPELFFEYMDRVVLFPDIPLLGETRRVFWPFEGTDAIAQEAIAVHVLVSANNPFMFREGWQRYQCSSMSLQGLGVVSVVECWMDGPALRRCPHPGMSSLLREVFVHLPIGTFNHVILDRAIARGECPFLQEVRKQDVSLDQYVKQSRYNWEAYFWGWDAVSASMTIRQVNILRGMLALRAELSMALEAEEFVKQRLWQISCRTPESVMQTARPLILQLFPDFVFPPVPAAVQ